MTIKIETKVYDAKNAMSLTLTEKQLDLIGKTRETLTHDDVADYLYKHMVDMLCDAFNTSQVERWKQACK